MGQQADKFCPELLQLELRNSEMCKTFRGRKEQYDYFFAYTLFAWAVGGYTTVHLRKFVSGLKRSSNTEDWICFNIHFSVVCK